MNSMRSIYKGSLVSLGICVLIWFAYTILKPISFLFLTGIIFIMVYFFALYFKPGSGTNHIMLLSVRARNLSVIMLLLLFGISLKVMKDYQFPKEENPYFTNIDHHAISNYAIGFTDGIDLYREEADSAWGVWPSKSGSFTITASKEKGIIFSFRNFFTPVFGRKKDESVYLANPAYKEEVRDGFSIGDPLTSLTWKDVSSKKKSGIPHFSFKIIFTTRDPYLSNNGEKNFSYQDTIIIEDIELRKGLDMKNILRRSEQFKELYTREVLTRWLERYSKIYLIPDTRKPGNPGLQFFPPHDFFPGCKASLNGQELSPLTSLNVAFDIRDQFYTGLENDKKLMRIRPLNKAEKDMADENTHLLELNDFSYYTLKASSTDSQPLDKTQIRFLKNNYQQLGINEIREGFLFHDDIKQNGFTSFDAILKYYSAPTGTPLEYSIIGAGLNSSVNKAKQIFTIRSRNNALTWFFSIKDFSSNPYDFAHTRIYLALLMIFILVLVIFRPGINILYIETPVLMIIYMLMVFRLLLLWRVATFPPLTDISANEFTTLQLFDMRLFGIHLPVPFSVALVLITIITVFVYRLKKRKLFFNLSLQAVLEKNFSSILNRETYLGKKMFKIIKFFSHPVPLHLVILTGCALLHVAVKLEIMARISSILLPVASYFLFCHMLIKKGTRFVYTVRKYKFPFLNRISDFFIYWIESPVFLLSLVTLTYLAVFDTGFGVLFLFFLLFKNALFSFYRPPYTGGNLTLGQRLSRPSAYWIYGVIYLVIYLLAIGYKRSFYYLLEYKTLLLLLLVFFLGLAVFFLINKPMYRRIALGLSAVLLILLVIPQTRNFAEKKIEYKIRNVKYRTAVLTDPVENLLFDYQYNSSKEQKIIETAQGQWFINSYLNIDKDVAKQTDTRKIRLREHFNKGVDYTTQTRDVVLPRYVIAEFGGRTMALLLVLFALPLVLFFLSYRLTEERRMFQAGGYIGAMSLVLLFTLALFVWLTSTNRFVFFGQDFPFLSLTSRVSSMLPMLLFGVLLITKPLIRRSSRETMQFNIYRWLIFAAVLTGVILFSGRSNIMSEKKFKIDFSRMETRISGINDIFTEVQSQPGLRKNLLDDDFRRNPEKFITAVKQLLSRLYSDKHFKAIYNDATVYEQSILDELKANPRMGFTVSSPIHLKYDVGENNLSLAFNKYWHLELPAYDVKEVWQGDIMEGSFTKESGNKIPVKFQANNSAQVIIIPPSFLKPGEKPVGLLIMGGNKSDKDDYCYVFDKQAKKIRLCKPEDPVVELNDNHIVFFINDKKKTFNSWVMHDANYHYFAYNFLINGHQKHIYPLGSRFFWIRHWAQANKLFYEGQRQYGSNTVVALDYELNKQVNAYLQTELKQYKSQRPELTFSVIGADGNGQIRLMADYAAQRELIDPNDDRKVAQKENEQYFNVDSRAERLQWGNLNLLQMPLGPGSSMKPLVAAAVTSQLKAEWKDLTYLNGPVGVSKKGKPTITHYAGLYLGSQDWLVESANEKTDFLTYLSKSNNLYHSLIMFLGSYQKEDFYKEDNGYSLKNVLTKQLYGNNVLQYPVMALGEDGPFYFQTMDKWPLTNKITPKDGTLTYYGNTESLLANGLKLNFDLYVNPSDRNGQVKSKSSFTSLLPDSIMNKRIWSSPESSHFFQYLREAENPVENFSKGLRFPTLGGNPYSVTPLKMVEMYGKMTSLNPLFRGSIDNPKLDSVSWKYDTTWVSMSNYESFLDNYIFKGMENAVTGGTAASLTDHQNNYKGYFLYAKTGTIGNNDNENSKRLAIIITKNPIQAGDIKNNRFYIIYFTINDAYDTDDGDKSWFWKFYHDILDKVIISDSFKGYMAN